MTSCFKLYDYEGGCQHDAHDNRLYVHLARLPANLRQHRVIINFLVPFVHIAQTLRRKTDSGFLAGLKNTHPAAEEG